MKAHRVVERQHPIFSPIALSATALLIVGLGLAVVLTGGRAFSPGELSAQTNPEAPSGEFASHDAFADDCARCHAPFAGIDASRCVACHESVATQRQAGLGLHGLLTDAGDCAACHQEHQGRAYNLTAAAAANYDHETTRFSLTRHASDYDDADIRCLACHNAAASLRQLPTPCRDCHQAGDAAFMRIHEAEFGLLCLDCHDGIDSLADMSVDDHAEFFTLSGSHRTASCAACHGDGVFEGTPTACMSCHLEPARHVGQFGDDCAACHEPTGWEEATLDPLIFDHARDTGFSLDRHRVDYDASSLRCVACHQGPDLALTAGSCETCHGGAEPGFMAEHSAQFGGDCLSCHDGVDRMADFDHAAVFPLTGAHQEASCAGCHEGRAFAGTPTACIACHDEPSLHAGLFGVDCVACHATTAWRPAQLTQHAFPLTHGDEGEIACATCHTVTFTAYTCAACHEPTEMAEEHLKEGISPAELPDCARCHPTGLKDEAEDD